MLCGIGFTTLHHRNHDYISADHQTWQRKIPRQFLAEIENVLLPCKTAGRYVMSFLHVGTACNNISEFHCSRIWRPSRMQIYPDPIHWFPQAPTMLEAVAGHSWFGIHRGVFAELRLQTLKQFVHLTFWSRAEGLLNPTRIRSLKLQWQDFTGICYGSNPSKP